MKRLNLTQGSPEWNAHRAKTRNASDAPAMMGVSPYVSRAELVKRYATGITPEIDAATQRVFDRGHEVEPALIALAEHIIADELYPATVTNDDGYLGASLDGMTMDGSKVAECKQTNKAKQAHIREHETVPPEDYWQCIQQMAITGAEILLYLCGDGTPEGTATCWMEPQPAEFATLRAAWAQFDQDVAAYKPEPVKAEVAAAPVEGFGALMLRVEGKVLASNMSAFKADAEAFLARLPKAAELQTDQDFADAEAAVKACGDAEGKIKAQKEAALAQMADVDALLRTADNIAETIRQARLSLEKVVKAEKENRRAELIRGGVDAVRDHYHGINATLPGYELSVPGSLTAEIGAAIKGLRSIDSARDKIATAVANAKIAASQEADRRRACIAVIDRHAQHRALIPDAAALVASKSPEDLANLIAARVAEHEQREQARQAAERERIRQEEGARLQREFEQQQRAEQAKQAAEHRRRVDAHASAERSESNVAHMIDPGPVYDNGQRIRLGEINSVIAPLKIDADGLAQLGFEPVATEKAAKLYRAADLPRMLGAMSRHLLSAETLRRAA